MNRILLLILIGISGTISAHAQSKVTFNINLQPLLEDSTFVPGMDIIEVTGDLTPFSRTRRFELKDTAPVDSIYSVTVDFPVRFVEEILTYNFIIRSKYNYYKEKAEGLPRIIRIQRMPVETTALQFDTYAN